MNAADSFTTITRLFSTKASPSFCSSISATNGFTPPQTHPTSVQPQVLERLAARSWKRSKLLSHKKAQKAHKENLVLPSYSISFCAFCAFLWRLFFFSWVAH